MARKQGHKEVRNEDQAVPYSFHVKYIPPKSEEIWAFAHQVCEALATEKNDSSYLQHHVIQGLARFIEIVARMEAKRLSSEQMVDDNEK